MDDGNKHAPGLMEYRSHSGHLGELADLNLLPEVLPSRLKVSADCYRWCPPEEKNFKQVLVEEYVICGAASPLNLPITIL